MAAPRPPVLFQVYSWTTDHVFTQEGKRVLRLHATGRSGAGDKVHVVITGLRPHVYVQLPPLPAGAPTWDTEQKRHLLRHIQTTFPAKARPVGPATPQVKELLHYRERMDCLLLQFPTQYAVRDFARRMSHELVLPSVGSFPAGAFRVHEDNVDPIIKYTAARDIELAGWLVVDPQRPGVRVRGEEEGGEWSTADVAHIVDVAAVRAARPGEAPDVGVLPDYLSFDIECYSDNHNAIPDPEGRPNVVFQISAVFGQLHTTPRAARRRMLFTLGDPTPLPGVEVHRCTSETDLLLSFARCVTELRPDVFVGYNTMTFDWRYMIARAELLGVLDRFRWMGWDLTKACDIKSTVWNSAAYGPTEIQYVEAKGVTNIDVLVEVKRNFKEPKYSLNYIAGKYLGAEKEDVSPRELFLIWRLYREVAREWDRRLPPTVEYFEYLRRRVTREWLPDVAISSVTTKNVRALRGRLLAARSFRAFQTVVREGLALVGRYCVKDSDLPVDLCEKLNVWHGMEQMANCTNVPMSYLHTRGQQIKVMAQIYRDARKEGLVLTHCPRTEEQQRYQGATVVEAVAGWYRKVSPLDFASLYPTTMIANNICPTTAVRATDTTVEDAECHVIAWEDHVGCGCPGDTKVRKTKVPAKDVLCGSHRYRFRRARYHPDGRVTGEGLLPRLLRRLLATRKAVKQEMGRAEATVRMVEGKASAEDREEYARRGWEVVAPGALPAPAVEKLRVRVKVLNARQLALKVSANSMYGALGAKNGLVPLVSGAASVTAMGRKYIEDTIAYVRTHVAEATVVYGDTDSAMCSFPQSTTPEAFVLAKRTARAVTQALKCAMLGVPEDKAVEVGGAPTRLADVTRADVLEGRVANPHDASLALEYLAMPILLEFECMYDPYLLLTKKRYLAHQINEEDTRVGMTKKGVALKRRDNSGYLKLVYGDVVRAIMDNATEAAVMEIVHARVMQLFTRRVPDAELVVYQSVKSLEAYARNETEDGKTFLKTETRSVKQPDGTVTTVTQKVRFTPRDGLDPRLEYTRIPQVRLLRRMMRRGQIIPAGSRLGALYVERPGEEEPECQGDAAEEWEYYQDHKRQQRLRPLYTHYLLKEVVKPVTEIMLVRFPDPPKTWPDDTAAFHHHLEQLPPSDLFAVQLLQTGPGRRRRNKAKVLRAQVAWVLRNKARVRGREQGPELVNCAHRLRSAAVVKALVHKRTGRRTLVGVDALFHKPVPPGTPWRPKEKLMERWAMYHVVHRTVIKQLQSAFHDRIFVAPP